MLVMVRGRIDEINAILKGFLVRVRRGKRTRMVDEARRRIMMVVVLWRRRKVSKRLLRRRGKRIWMVVAVVVGERMKRAKR